MHAIYLRDVQEIIAPALKPVVEAIRGLSPSLTDDRSITAELEKLAIQLSADEFSSVRVDGKSDTQA